MPKSLNFWPAPWTHIIQSQDIKLPIEPTVYWSKHLCSRCLNGLRCRYVMSVRARNRESIKNHQNCQWMRFSFWFTKLNRQLLISFQYTDNQVKVWLLDSKWISYITIYESISLICKGIVSGLRIMSGQTLKLCFAAITYFAKENGNKL